MGTQVSVLNDFVPTDLGMDIDGSENSVIKSEEVIKTNCIILLWSFFHFYFMAD